MVTRTAYPCYRHNMTSDVERDVIKSKEKLKYMCRHLIIRSRMIIVYNHFEWALITLLLTYGDGSCL